MDNKTEEDQPKTVPQFSPPPEEMKTHVSTPEASKQELQEAIKGSNEILVSITSAFPLFPDTVTLDRAKLNVTKRTFVSSAELLSSRVEDVLNVTTTVGPMFGSIKIVSRVLSSDTPYVVKFLWRKDAMRIKRIVQGYVIALQRKIDCSSLPKQELVAMLDQLGSDEHPAA